MESITSKNDTDEMSKADDISFLSNLRSSGFAFDINTDILDDDDLFATRPFNQRISLPSTRGDEFEQSPAYDEGFGDIDEDELSRDRVKKMSSQLISALERKKAKEKKALE